MNDTYQFKDIELKRYETWVKKGFFNSGDVSKKPFTIVMPPPNVTGKLHLGHAWDQTLQDIIIRRKRMQGFDALYLPGMDHAGIATQAKVDERLKQMGTNRFELGREGFLKKAWEWKDEYARVIKSQWAAMGVSVDYSKERFTLDETLNKAVNHTFITLYNEGLIYRDYRIISWDSQAKTALSNIEVDYVETQSKLYHIKYPFVEGDGFLEIATTRPETMFADQALMVNPLDQRYQKFIGRYVYIPNTTIQIKVISDSYVDMTFGTGVVKVTPAHDPNDFEVGKRHHLEMPLCMDETGHMNALSGIYEGLDRFECRKKVIVDLEIKGFIASIKDYTNQVGYSERTGVMVEPRLSLQWFVKMDSLALEALQTNTEFMPSRFRKIFDTWMTQTFDWCISRQLWWGHRIPAWYKDGKVKVQVEQPDDDWVQDEDVLDTWFSSALWPFSTLGYPEETVDYKRYYPTQVLVTGYDIIFFWVARMIFQGRHFTHQDPFEHVLIHGLIRDAQGKKMSKSLGNGVDPMDVMNTYGVDALRYFLTTNSAPGLDMRYDETKVESSWNFLNKLWHVSRYVMMSTTKVDTLDRHLLKPMDKWILHALSQTITDADMYYEKYEFGEAAKVLYAFIWDMYANTYVEYAKVALKEGQTHVSYILRYALETILKLMHPFVPFVTDVIYQELTGLDTLTISDWPVAIYHFKASYDEMELMLDVIKKMRHFRNETQIFKPLTLYYKKSDSKFESMAKAHASFIQTMLKLDHMKAINENELQYMTPLSTTYMTVYVLTSDVIDLEKEKELKESQIKMLHLEIERSLKLLNNPSFLEKAHPDKIKLEKEKYEAYLLQLKALKG